MLVGIYIALALVSFGCLFASVMIADSYYKVFYAFVSMVLFFYLGLSSGAIQQNWCEIPDSNTTFVCSTDIVDVDSSQMVLFSSMGMLSLIIAFLGALESFRGK